MNTNNQLDLNHQIALFRYGLIIPILNHDFPDDSITKYCQRITSNPIAYIDGTSITISANTVRYWGYLYRKYGFKGLYPKARSDLGHSRVLSTVAKDEITRLLSSNHRLTATAIYLKLIHDGFILKRDVSLSTITRFVSSIKPSLNVVRHEDMRAFEMKHTNDLWQIDTTYCSHITIDGKKHRTFLIMIVDDFSRMIVGHRFFLEDNAINVQLVLKQAILKYGIPKRIYTDNGTPYKNNQLSLITAQLQIQLVRAQPYHGNQKGKVERAFRSVKEQWMYQTDFSLFKSIDDVSDAFTHYVNSKNNSLHASLPHCSPIQRFMSDPSSIRRLDPLRIEEAFYHTVTRRVANDATIKLLTLQYETSQQYISQTVTIKYLPDLSFVYLYDDHRFIQIHEVNKVDNAHIKRNTNYFSGGQND